MNMNLENGNKPLSIFVFSWNTESVRLSETLSVEEATVNRQNYLSGYRFSYHVPDFFPYLTELIQHKNPDIVVIGFQEDAYPGSYFHSHLLIQEMPKYGYKLV